MSSRDSVRAIGKTLCFIASIKDVSPPSSKSVLESQCHGDCHCLASEAFNYLCHRGWEIFFLSDCESHPRLELPFMELVWLSGVDGRALSVLV